MQSLKMKAQKIERLADYLESACIPNNDLDVAKAAVHQLWCAECGDSGRWEDAKPSEVKALRKFVNTHCRKYLQ